MFLRQVSYACCWIWTFSRSMFQNTFFRRTLAMDCPRDFEIRSTRGLGPRSNFSLSARGGSVNYIECVVRFHGSIVIIWDYDLHGKHCDNYRERLFKLVVDVVVDWATRGLVVKRNLTLDPGPLSIFKITSIRRRTKHTYSNWKKN